jgi:chromosome segregation ATPase
MSLDKVEKLRKIGEANQLLAKYERDNSRNLKSLANGELEKAKARENLIEKQLKLCEIRRNRVEIIKKMNQEKIIIKKNGIIDFPEEELKAEKHTADYNQLVSDIQTEIANIHKKISNLQKDLAQEKIRIAEKRMKIADRREKIGRKMVEYSDILSGDPSDSEISKSQKEYKTIQKKLNKDIEKIFGMEEETRRKENKLADLRKQLSNIMTDLEKIRHPTFVLDVSD